MIIFKGEISQECKNFIKRRQRFFALIKFVILFLALSLPVIFFALIINYWIFISLSFIFVIAVIDLKLDKSFKAIPNKIEIDESFIQASSKNYTVSMEINDIIEVIDMGTWYDFKFNLKVNNLFVCQKDLITQGSIEEFEQLFKDKIIRMIKD